MHKKLSAVLVTLIFSVSLSSGQAETPADNIVSRPAITVVSAEKKTLNSKIYASGYVVGQNEALVVPLIEGQTITSIVAEVGDYVRYGELLAKLDDSGLLIQREQIRSNILAAESNLKNAEAQLIEARAALVDAEKRVNRIMSLNERGVTSEASKDTAEVSLVSAKTRVLVSEQSVMAARAQLDSILSQLELVELNLHRTQVKAPFEGLVVEKNAKIGSLASAAGSPLFVIVENGLLNMEIDVSESDLKNIPVGSKSLVRFVGSEKTFDAVVSKVEPDIDRTTRLGRVILSLPEHESLVRGVFGQAEIIADSVSGVSVPVSALNSDSDGEFVMKVGDSGTVTKIYVTSGIQDNGWVEVKSGLELGALVVKKAGAFVRDGDIIQPVKE